MRAGGRRVGSLLARLVTLPTHTSLLSQVAEHAASSSGVATEVAPSALSHVRWMSISKVTVGTTKVLGNMETAVERGGWGCSSSPTYYCCCWSCYC